MFEVDMADFDEYMADEYDMDDLEDDMDAEFDGRDIDASDSEVDDFDQLNKAADTSAAQARNGKDIQGIPWDRLSVTRKEYRKTRLQQYKNYENVPNSGEESGKDCMHTEKGSSFYTFRRNSRSVRSTILHFQLRNLVWATSKHDVYLLSNYSISHWSSLTGCRNEILNVKGHVAPSEKHPESLLEGFTETQVSTLAVKERLLVAGGFQGELICKHLDRPGVSFCSRTTYTENAITNAVDIYRNSSGALHFMASNNDCGVRDFDMERYQLVQLFRYLWPVNHSSLSPDGKLVAVVGDDPDGLLVDSSNGQTVATLKGHLDFSFASAWHPEGVTFATGNQDKTCRIWDTRNLSESVAVLKGNLGAVRSIRFSSDGRYIAMAEPADFVHIYDTKTGYKKEQEIDFFGEISGISFSPDTESLFVGVWDRTYGSLLEYGRTRDYSYLDSLL
uniref:Putative WD repeat-containing protein C2A9.03 n=1 Tax=Noccaea caerulescens TaxID=107243 RepID=A0A1J3E7N4_NOCCA